MSQTRTAELVRVDPPVPARAAVVWLHGLGADGDDFVPIVPALGIAERLGIRFLFPHAPVQPVTLNGGLPMRSWFDILSLDRRGRQDEAGITSAQQRINRLIDGERASGIPSERIVIAGFSQGGALALHTALRYPARLGGLLAMSTYLPLEHRLPTEASTINHALPICMQHGRFDPVLPLTLGEVSRDYLRELGYTVDWTEYPMQHEVCPQQIADIAHFLEQCLG